MTKICVLMIVAALLSSCEGIGGKKSRLETILDQGAENVQPRNARAGIGAKEHPKILAANGGIYSNAALKKQVDKIAKNLISFSGEPEQQYTITILNTPIINAFALPGGYLYVTRGLLALATDSAEVAAVLAHEMAHVSANHGIERSRRFEATKLANRVALDVLTNDRASKIALAANKIKLAKFSQNQELQADAIGIKMIGKAGFDAYAGARFLKAMDDYTRYQNTLSKGNGAQDFLASHPSTPRRIELARRHARFFGAPGSGISNRDEYLQGINGILYGDSAEEGFVRGNRFSHAGLGITFSAPSGFDIENNAEAVVVSGPGEIAIRFDGVSQSRRTGLADYMKSGWVNGLDANSVTLGNINGLDAAFGQAMADQWLFHITLIRDGTQVYRFILAAPKSTANAASISGRVTGTFRKLTRRERRNLKPLRIKVVRASGSDSISSLAGGMQGVARKLKLFRLLNGMRSGETLKPGQLVKLVVSN